MFLHLQLSSHAPSSHQRERGERVMEVMAECDSSFHRCALPLFLFFFSFHHQLLLTLLSFILLLLLVFSSPLKWSRLLILAFFLIVMGVMVSPRLPLRPPPPPVCPALIHRFSSSLFPICFLFLCHPPLPSPAVQFGECFTDSIHYIYSKREKIKALHTESETED